MRMAIIAAAALVAAGCAGTGQVIETTGRSLSATMTGTGSYDGRAAVAVNTTGNSTAATIALAGDQNGAARPWHIHTGTCGSGGGVVGAAAAYPPLTVGSNGRANAEARLNVGLQAGQSYHVNIHESASNLGNVIACANLR
ncbi:MAG: hypothetical protein WEB88_16770 [Gemmatimonadota bacterium]